MEIIITDMTRFSKENILCIAGIDLETNQCVRPMPYLDRQKCEACNMIPGAILEGDFSPQKTAPAPHTEDHDYTKCFFKGPSTAEDFKKALQADLADSVENGFGIPLADKQKYYPPETPPDKSIITVMTDDISIVKSKYEPYKPRIVFTDRSGRTFWYLPITDLGFYNYAMEHNSDDGRKTVNRFLRRQQEIYLRIGLSRIYRKGDQNGYWLQVNGIYTFPDILTEARCHS